MNLRQLQCLWETYRHDLNLSSAAITLHTSQPSVSKQLRLLESELGVELFARRGKRLSSLTPAGKTIVELAGNVLHQVEAISLAANEYTHEDSGSLRIATTHTQARYVLPTTIKKFLAKYPKVSLHVNQGAPAQLAELAENAEVDFAIATEGFEHFADLIMVPCYYWNRSVVVPEDHPLVSLDLPLTMEDLRQEKLVTYVFGFAGESSVARAFRLAGIKPNVVFTATDTDVIKKYVRLGLGVGIIASMAIDPQEDEGLVAIDAAHLFEPSTTNIGFRKGVFLRSYMYEFIEMFSNNLTPALVGRVLAVSTHKERQELVEGIKLPFR